MVKKASKMKMSTEVPEGIATPDRLETRIGTLNLVEGVPDKKTAQEVYDNLYFQRGVQAYLTNMVAVRPATYPRRNEK